jgi:hypothetical protein
VGLEASTKPHVHKKIHEFLINMAFTMACTNFKKGVRFGALEEVIVSAPTLWRRICYVELGRTKGRQ